MINEPHYRKIIRPEHWNEFEDRLVGLEDIHNSVQAEAKFAEKQAEAYQWIRNRNLDLYPDDEDC